MLFNSLDFMLFFPLVYFLYYLLGKKKYRNLFLLLASYYFYMNWEPIYAVLILTSTILTYGCGLLVDKHSGNKNKQKGVLIASLILNFGILFVFKYFNFINESIFGTLSSMCLILTYCYLSAYHSTHFRQ